MTSNNPIAYTVFCTINYKTMEKEWLEWMQGEHIAAVLAAGADSAELIRQDSDQDRPATVTYEIRYKFDTRGKFEEYLENHAPRLRQESAERFSVTDGIHYKRSVGEVV